MADWKSAVKIPSGGKLFQVHKFNFMCKGSNFKLEVDEYQDGQFTGHAEHATDHNFVIQSVTAKSMADCLSELLNRINSRT